MSINPTRYALWFLGTGLATMLVVVVAQTAFGISIGTAFVPIIPAMIAALVEGAKFATVSDGLLPEPWKEAGYMTGLALALTALLLVGTALPSGAESGLSITGLGVVLAIYAAFFLIINRLFLAMGARNARAAQNRRDS